MADIPAPLRSWSVTAGSNSPATTTVVGAGLAPNLQQIQATVRQYLASIGSSVVCAATTDLSTVDGYTIPLSGSATVTSFGTEQSGISYRLMFSGTPLLKGSTAIQTPTATSGDVSIVSGDVAEVVSLGSGNWRISNVNQQSPRFSTVAANSANISATSGVNTLSASAISGVASLNAASLNVSVITATSEVFLGSASVVSGVGVAFPATQSPSTDVNTLDDYSEKSWTPSLGGTATYNQQAGTITKIGNRFFVYFLINVSTIGTGSTSVVSGYPNTPNESANSPCPVLVVGSATSIVSAMGYFGGGASTITIKSRTAAAASDSVNPIFANSTIVTGFFSHT